MSLVRDRICRLLELLGKIQSGRMNAQDLAREIEVSRRTVYRDIRVLQEAGLPIVFDREQGAYSLKGNYLLPPTNFSTEEALALLVLCADVGEQTQLPFFEPARSAALKLAAMLPKGLSDEIQATNTALTVKIQQTTSLEGRRRFFDELVAAYRDRASVRIRYKSPAETDEIQTLLSPFKLLFSVRSWYVIGRSSVHRQTRTFHVGRILDIERTERRYAIPRNFSLKRYLRNAWRLIPEPGPDQEVTVHFSRIVAQNVAEIRWHDTQRTEYREDGSLDFHVTVSGLNEIAWWILGYGHHAEVIRPQRLRDIVAEHVAQLAHRYGASIDG